MVGVLPQTGRDELDHFLCPLGSGLQVRVTGQGYRSGLQVRVAGQAVSWAIRI